MLKFFNLIFAGIIVGYYMFAASPGAALEKRLLVKRIETYINNITTLEGNFTQTGPGERIARGKFWISRPGRLRFNYAPPERVIITADGTWLMIQNKKDDPAQRFPLELTPARFILSSNMRIQESAYVKKLEQRGNSISLWLISRDKNLAGEIKLRFRKNPLALKGWTIIDAQNMRTHIMLKNVRRDVIIDPMMFIIKENPIFKKRR